MLVKQIVPSQQYNLTFNHEEARDLQNGIWRALHDKSLPPESKASLMALYKDIRDVSGYLSKQDQD